MWSTDVVNVWSRVPVRGVCMDKVLSSFGQIFACSAGSAETYRCSEAVDQLDGFISHNWSTPRSSKFLSLAILHNNVDSVIAAIFSVGASTALVSLGYFPIVDYAVGYGVGLEMSFANLVIAAPVSLFVLLTAHEWRKLIPGRRRFHVFLDKVCIHQTDELLKQQGIDSIGHFLCSADNLIILYSNLYLRKIWTVYEFACFLCHSSAHKCVLLPVFLPKILMYTWIASYLYVPITAFLWSCDLNFQVVYACWCVILLAFFQFGAGLGQIYYRELAQMRDAMECFKVDGTICHDEADRPKVYGLIAAFMCFKGFVAPGASREAALQEFEVLVRKHVGRLVDTMFGLDTKAGIRYKIVIVISSIYPLHLGDVLGSKLARSKPWIEIIMVALYYLNSWFFMTPVMLVGVLFFCRRCQVESTFKRHAFMSGFFMIYVPVWLVVDHACAELFLRRAGRLGAHVGWYMLVAALLATEGATTWWLYRRPSGPSQAAFARSGPAIAAELRRSIMGRMESLTTLGENGRGRGFKSRMGRIWSCASDTPSGQTGSCKSGVKAEWSIWSCALRGTSCNMPPPEVLPTGPLSSVVFESI